jgi:hypothetical protein
VHDKFFDTCVPCPATYEYFFEYNPETDAKAKPGGSVSVEYLGLREVMNEVMADGELRFDTRKQVCVRCPTGMVSAEAGFCRACPPHEYTADQLRCERCWPGATVNGTNNGGVPTAATELSAGCEQCNASALPADAPVDVARRANHNDDGRECRACPPGTRPDKEGDFGATHCVSCKADGHNRYSPDGLSCRWVCPPGTQVNVARTGCTACAELPPRPVALAATQPVLLPNLTSVPRLHGRGERGAGEDYNATAASLVRPAFSAAPCRLQRLSRGLSRSKLPSGRRRRPRAWVLGRGVGQRLRLDGGPRGQLHALPHGHAPGRRCEQRLQSLL